MRDANRKQTKPRYDLSSNPSSEKERAALDGVLGNILGTPSLPSEPIQAESRKDSTNTLSVNALSPLASELASLPTGEPIRELSRELIGQPGSKPGAERVVAEKQRPRSQVAQLRQSENFQWLDATHTASEQRVYSMMYRITIAQGMSDGYFSVKALQKATGIGGHDTVRKALKGLIAKYNIEIVNRERERTIGPLYRVYAWQDVEQRRIAAGIAVDPITKEIGALSELSNSVSVGYLTRDRARGLTGEHTRELAREPKIRVQALLKQESMNNISNSADSSPSGSSSSGQKIDDEKLRKVQGLFNQLSGGGVWRADRDELAYERIAHVNLYHIILGLCWSVNGSPEHKMSSLAYAVPSILKHSEDMAEFSEAVLGEIAYKSKIKALNCIQTGKWTVPDWEVGRE